MTNISDNLNQLYTLWTQKQQAEKSTDKNAKQRDINKLINSDKNLFDMTGDGTISYLDLIDFANLDMNGDGKTDATETAFINDMASYITKNYNASKDADLTKAINDKDLSALANFVSKTDIRENYYKSSNDLDETLESISKKFNNKLFKLTNTNISQTNVDILTNLEAQLDAVADYLNEELAEGEKPTEEQMKALFGDDLSKITPEYQAQLDATIKSVKTQMGVDNLTGTTAKNYKNYRTNSVVTTWEHAVAKQAFNANDNYFNIDGTSNFTFKGDIDGDGALDYKDIAALVNADLDNDNEATDEEKEVAAAMQSKMLSSYNMSKDTKLKNASTAEINTFLNAIKARGDISSSKDALDKKLVSIQNELNKNAVNIKKDDNNNYITQANVNRLTNLEAQLDAVADYLNEELEEGKKPTDEQMKKLFGDDFDLSKITPEYQAQLDATIKSVKTQMGVDNLSTSNQKKYDQYRANAAVTTWEHAIAKQAFNANGNYFVYDGTTNFTLKYDLDGDGELNYKDLAKLAKADFDGDGKSTDQEKEVAAALQADILKKYTLNKDTKLKSATMDELADFMETIQDRGNIFDSNDALDKQLENIQKAFNKNLSITTSSGINSTTVNKLVQLQANLEAAEILNNNKSSDTDKAYASNVLGDEASKVNADYIKDLETSIKSLQTQMSIPNGDTSSLSANKLKTYNALVATASGSKNITSVTKQQNIDGVKNTTDPVLKNAIDNIAASDKALLDTIDLTATFSNGNPQYVLVKGSKGKYNVYKFANQNSTTATAMTLGGTSGTTRTYYNVNTTSTQKGEENGLVYAKIKTEPDMTAEPGKIPNPEEQKMVDNPEEQKMVDNPEEQKMVDNPEEQKMVDNPEEQKMVDNPEKAKKVDPNLDATVKAAIEHEIEVAQDELVEGFVQELGFDYKGPDPAVKEDDKKDWENSLLCNNLLTEAVDKAVEQYKKDNEDKLDENSDDYKQAKDDFLNNVWANLPADYPELKNQFENWYTVKLTEEQFNKAKANNTLNPLWTNANTYEEYEALYDVNISDHTSTRKNIIDKVQEGLNSLGKIDDPNWEAKIPDPNWKAKIPDPNWAAKIPDPNWEAEVPDPNWVRPTITTYYGDGKDTYKKSVYVDYDPISFNLNGVQYDFIIDDGAFDSSSDFLGAKDYFKAMKNLDSDGDGKVTKKELEAGNIKLAKTENGVISVVDVSSVFDDDDFVDISSYIEKNSVDNAKNQISNGKDSVTLGTFNLTLGADNQTVSGSSSLDSASFLNNFYGFPKK